MTHDAFHMSPEDFRKHGHALMDWIARYMQKVESKPVLAQVKPGEIRAKLPSHAPTKGESFEAMMRDVNEIIMPGITHWQSPNFFGYFPCNNSGPSILGELLSAGLGVQGMLWATSPACTELETHVLDWMAEMLALPAKFMSSSNGGGVIQDTASSATLCALLAARERATNFTSNQHGVGATSPSPSVRERASGIGVRAQPGAQEEPTSHPSPSPLPYRGEGEKGKLIAYTSTQAHSSIEKAMMIAGLGRGNLRLIDAPANSGGGFAMDVAALERAIVADLKSGHIPCFICAAVGTTSSNAIDPIRRIAQLARLHAPGIWLHVDAAMSGIAAICPEFRHFHDGLEFADSYCTNPHKWMFTNFDCDCFWVADRAALIRTLSVLPEYLKNQATESGAVIDYRDWQIPLGRRFRALKLWFVIRHYGVEGLQHHIREHVRLAQEFASWVRADDRFELPPGCKHPPLNLVCFRLKSGGDAANQQLLDRLNASGKMFLTHTKLDGKFTLRMCIGQSRTERRHVEQAWEMIQGCA